MSPAYLCYYWNNEGEEQDPRKRVAEHRGVINHWAEGEKNKGSQQWFCVIQLKENFSWTENVFNLQNVE